MIGVPGGELEKRALREAADGKGTRFDPRVVDAFIEVLSVQGGAW